MENGQTGQTGKSETQNERIKNALKLQRGHPQFGRQTGPIRLDSLLVIPADGNAKVDGSAKVVQETPFAYLTWGWATSSPPVVTPFQGAKLNASAILRQKLA